MKEKIDQAIELLEKVYAEVLETKKEVRLINQRISKLEAIVENEVKSDVKTMYE